MKKGLLLIIVLLVSGLLIGYNVWDDNGIMIRQETNLYWEGTDAQLSDGSSVIMWSDGANGEQELRMQRLDSAGVVLWGENGVLICGEHYTTHEYQIALSASGEIFAAWLEQDLISGHERLKAQKLNFDGDLLWGEDGLIIADFAEYVIRYTIAADGVGNTCYCMDIAMDEEQVLLQKYNAAGEIAAGWSQSGISITAPGSCTNYGSVVFSGDNIICFWMAANNYYWEMYYQLYSPTGQELLTAGGVELENQGYTQRNISTRAVTNEQTLIAYNYSNDRYNDVRVNLLNADGEYIWQQPLIIEMVSSTYLEIVSSMENEYFLLWNNAACGGEFMISKFDLNGNLLWDEPYSVPDLDYNQFDARGDTAGGIWYCTSAYYPAETALQHINADAEPDYQESIELFAGGRFGFYPQIILADEEHALLAISGEKDDSQCLKLQGVDLLGELMFEAGGNAVYSKPGGYVLDCNADGCIEYTAAAWVDTRNDLTCGKVYIQIIDNSSGEEYFVENGIPVGNNVWSEPGVKISEDFSQIALAWYSPDGLSIYIQIVDLEGNLLFGEEALNVALPVSYTITEGVKIENMDSGFLLAADIQNPDNCMLLLHKFTANGLQWGNGGVLLNVESGNSNIILHDIKDKYLIYSYNHFYDENLKIIRINEAGEPAAGWLSAGLPVSATSYEIVFQEAELNNDQLLVIWTELTGDHYRESKGQLVAPDGTIFWEDGGKTLIEDVLPQGQESCELKFIDDQSFVFACRSAENDIYNTVMQRFDFNGDPLWNDCVVPFSDETCISQKITCCDGVIALYASYYTSMNDNNLFGAFYDLQGNLLPYIPEAGFPICTKPHSQKLFFCSQDEQGYNYLLWRDCRAQSYYEEDSSIYMQKIALPAVAIDDDGIFSIENFNYPNPFSQKTQISYQLSRNDADAVLMIYNLKGQLVKKIKAQPDGSEWDCTDQNGNKVGSGVYFYKLSGGETATQARKMILIR